MGNFYRFLCVLSTVLCLALPARADIVQGFVSGCWNDCDAMSDTDIQSMAESVIRCNNQRNCTSSDYEKTQQLKQLQKWSYCHECSNNVIKVADRIRRQAQKNYDDCMAQGIDPNLCEADRNRARAFALTQHRDSVFCLKAAIGNSSGAGTAVIYTKILDTFLSFGGSGCWFCPIFDTIFNTINTMATKMYDKLRGLCLALVMTFGMAWLLWTIFKFITTIHGPNVGELMTTLFKGLGTIMLVSIVLSASPSFITRYVIDPFAALGSGLSQEIMNLQGTNNKDTITYSRYIDGNCGNGTVASRAQDGQIKVCTRIPSNSFEGLALSADVYNDMNCLLRRISLELVFGMALGAAIFTEGLSGGLFNVLPQFSLLLVGALILCAYLMLFISIPFKLIDILLRIGFVVILLPFFVACMTTKVTRAYAKKGWDMFLGCWITLIALCLFITFSLQLIAVAMQ